MKKTKISSELQNALDRFPKILKRNKAAAKEKAKLKKIFQESLGFLFTNEHNDSAQNKPKRKTVKK